MPEPCSRRFLIFWTSDSSCCNILRTVSFIILSLLVTHNNILNQAISALRILRSSSFFKHQHSDTYTSTNTTKVSYNLTLTLTHSVKAAASPAYWVICMSAMILREQVCLLIVRVPLQFSISCSNISHSQPYHTPLHAPTPLTAYSIVHTPTTEVVIVLSVTLWAGWLTNAALKRTSTKLGRHGQRVTL